MKQLQEWGLRAFTFPEMDQSPGYVSKEKQGEECSSWYESISSKKNHRNQGLHIRRCQGRTHKTWDPWFSLEGTSGCMGVQFSRRLLNWVNVLLKRVGCLEGGQVCR